MKYKNTTVVIPTLNEEANIADLIKTIRKSYPEAAIIIADGGSSDQTREIAEDLAGKKVRFLGNKSKKIRGITESVIDASKIAETDYLVVIDGDFQHPPEKIREIVEKLEAGADIAIGTRAEVVSRWPLKRRLMSCAATWLARIRLMRWIEDPMSGFFGIKRSLFERIATGKKSRFEMQGYKVLFDVLKCASSAKTARIFYRFGARRRGKSKINGTHVMSFLRALFK